MYGGALLEVKRYSALKSTTYKLCAIFSHLERKNTKKNEFSKLKKKKKSKIALCLLALSQELPCFSEKEEISVTPMYRWDLLYECATMDVQKGLRFCLRLSFTLYCHGLPVPKEKKKH